MSKNKEAGFVKSAVIWLADYIPWIEENLRDSKMRNAILLDLGLDPSKYAEPKLPAENINSIDRYRNSVDVDEIATQSVLNDLEAVYDAIKAFLLSGSVNEGIEELVYQFFNLMAVNYIRMRYPGVYWVCQVLGFIAEFPVVTTKGTYGLVGLPTTAKLVGENIWKFLSHPIKFFKNLIKLLPTLETQKEAQSLSSIFLGLNILFAMAEIMIGKSSFRYLYGWDSAPENDPKDWADVISKGIFSFDYQLDENNADTRRHLGGSLLFVSKEVAENPGLFLSLNGDLNISTPLNDDWELNFEFSSGDIVDIFLGSQPSFSGPSDARISFSVQTKSDTATGKILTLPDEKGSRVEIGKLAFSLLVSNTDAGFAIELKDIALILSTNDLDDFLKEIIPSDDIALRFTLSAGYEKEQGFFLNRNFSWPSLPSGSKARSLVQPEYASSRGLEVPKKTQEEEFKLAANFPINKKAGPLSLESVEFDYGAATSNGKPGVALSLGATVNSKLGPIYVRVENIGINLGAYVPKDRANLLLVDFKHQFQPPNGLALYIDTKVVRGGGFLRFDEKKGQYDGIIQLEFSDWICLTAIGLLNTRLPNGKKGYSLLIIITADGFTPIQLGFGFMLTKVGGLLGVNRGVAQEELSKSLAKGGMESILFPKNPLARVGQIISDLSRFFPPTPKQYVFGPMAEISWGTPVMMRIKLAIILEFPVRTVLHILARLEIGLPTLDKALANLNLNARGALDFDKQELSIAAELDETSNILKIPLRGGMAFYLNWGEKPNFLLSVGGFNPHFRAPSGFSKVSRISFGLSKEENIAPPPGVYYPPDTKKPGSTVNLQAYFAVTSNTVQFGADFYLHVSGWSFSVEGWLYFHALFQFDPFQFIIDVGGGITIKWFGINLLSVWLDLTLSGPQPWHAKGEAHFEICWIDFSVSFDRNLSEGTPPPPPPPVNPLPQLVAALEDARNWQGQMPRGRYVQVTLREIPAPEGIVLIHPMMGLEVRQRVLPLNMEISRFGNSKPAGDTRYKVSMHSAAPKDPDILTDDVQDYFAMAQFEAGLSDNDKLSRASFEMKDAGIRTKQNESYYNAQLVMTTDISFQTQIIGNSGILNYATQEYPLPGKALEKQAGFGAAGRRRGKDKYKIEKFANQS